jgi:hypothetical protein
MRAHQIENGIVINTIVVNSFDVLPNLIEASNGGAIGDLWDGQTFTTPPASEVIVVPAPSKEDLQAQLAALSAQIQALE